MDPLQSLLTVFLAQLDSAMNVSYILSEHNGDKKVTPDSLIGGLIYRLMVPMTDQEMQESMATGQQLTDEIYAEEDDEDDEEEAYEGDDESLGSPEPKTLRSNSCNCDVCSKARACIANYSSYEATDPLAQKFHEAIKHSCATHNLRIS